MEIYPQALAALAKIRHLPLKIILVTNQSAVGRGIISLTTAHAINQRLVAEIERANGRVDAAYLCPHAPDDHCSCRKPLPGLLHQAARKYDIDLSHSVMIGDALTDLAAGKAAGVKEVVLLKTGRGVRQLELKEAEGLRPFAVYDALGAALEDLYGLD